MKSLGRIAVLALVALFTSDAGMASRAAQRGALAEEVRSERPALDMTKAVACKRVDGFEQFVTLPDSALTSEDKLLVYYRPLNFKVDPVEKPTPGHRYRAKFSQDGRIRRKGDKTVVMKKDNILEYDPTFETPSERIYLINTVGLKGLPPGEYEFDIVLRDALDEGSTATQSLPFTIIPLPKVVPAPKNDGPDEPEGAPSPVVEAKSKSRKSKKP